MTLRSFGRAVPIHMDMLRLLGYVFANRNMTRATTDDGKIEAMRDGQQRLVHATGQDFGFDVSSRASWHLHILPKNANPENMMRPLFLPNSPRWTI